jgi:hypothetical protein
MEPVNVSVVIDAPREVIFDFLQDVANRPRFTDHFMVDWHLTREDSRGTGAGARFRVKAPANRFSWGDLTLAEVEPVHRLVEVGRTGKANRIRTLGVYELSAAAAGTTRVSFTYETKPRLLSDRIREALGGRWWTRREYARALRRLRAVIESAQPPPVTLPRGMRSARNPALLLASALLAALSLGACGSSNEKATAGTYAGEAGVSAPYLMVGPLVYQVQVSRALNPHDEEDSSYLAGLTPAQANLAFGEEWFGVFIQVHNNTAHPHLAASAPSITDTQGHTYYPVIPLGHNPYIYLGGVVPPDDQIPGLNTPAAAGPTQGSLLLYRIRDYSLENRPIVLKIIDRTNPLLRGSAELDV